MRVVRYSINEAEVMMKSPIYLLGKFRGVGSGDA